LWAVSQDDPKRTAEYRERFGITYPVLIDAPGLEASRLYDPPSTPALYLVGANGRLEYVSEGFAKADLNELAAIISAHVGAERREVAPAGDGNPAMKPGCMARQRMPQFRRT
jgi:hypothetical protein